MEGWDSTCAFCAGPFNPHDPPNEHGSTNDEAYNPEVATVDGGRCPLFSPRGENIYLFACSLAAVADNKSY
jgi:hypothetical protein